MNIKEKQELFELIRDQDYELNENQSAEEILEIALSELGNTDPYIRDELAFEVAAYLIYKDYFSEVKLKELAKRLLSNEFLFYGLGEKTEDSVFIRTFTSLLLAMFFRIQNKGNIFSEKELEDIFNKYLTYLKNEYDYRGYVEDKGWAHFFAHSSDLLKYLFQQKAFDDVWLKRYLDVILKIIQNNQYVFHHNEDERFKNAFIVLLGRKDIDSNIIEDFLGETIHYERVKKLPEDLNAYVNVKNFLRAIYFALDESDCRMIDLIKKLNANLKVNKMI